MQTLFGWYISRHPVDSNHIPKLEKRDYIGKRYGNRKIRYLPEEHAQTFGIVGAAWFVN